MRLMISSTDHYTVLAKGLQYTSSNDAVQAQEESRDDVLEALDAVLVLATSLVAEGPWWKEAKAHHPVLLVDTLETIGVGLLHSALNCNKYDVHGPSIDPSLQVHHGRLKQLHWQINWPAI
jgi:hypothetical protein